MCCYFVQIKSFFQILCYVIDLLLANIIFSKISMPEYEIQIENSFLNIIGKGDFVTQPGHPSALIGKITQKKLPLMSGNWKNWLKRFFTPDRFRLRLSSLEGKAWFAIPDKPFLSRLTPEGDAPISVLSANLLACPWQARTGAQVLRLLPGSTREAMCISTISSEWVIMATSSPLTQIKLEANETAACNRSAVIAWSGLTPRGFCKNLSLRDFILPRLPENLILNFTGPATIWLQTPQAHKQKARNRTNCQ